jgi:hypothetical protein
MKEPIIESFRIEGRAIKISGSGSNTVVEIFFPYTKEAITHIREGSFLALENVRSQQQRRIFSLFNVVSYDVFHSGLTDLDPTKVPFPESVIEVAKRAFDELVEGTPDHNMSLAGIKVRCIPAGYEIVDDANQTINSSTEKPLIGSMVYHPTIKVLDKMFNQGLSLDDNAIEVGEYHHGIESVQILLNPKKLIQHHIGVFASTGAGKSFLISNLIRETLNKGIRSIIFDTVPEFPALLIDVIDEYVEKHNENFKTSIIFRNKEDIIAVNDAEALLERITIPEPLREYREKIREVFDHSKYLIDPVPKIMLPFLTSSEIINLVKYTMGIKRLPQADTVADTMEQTIEDRYPDQIFAGNVPGLSEYVSDFEPIQHIFDIILHEQSRIDNEKDVTYKFYDSIYELLRHKSLQRDHELSSFISEIQNHYVQRNQVIEPRDLITPLLEGDTRLHIVISDPSDDTKHLMSNAISNAFALQKGKPDNRLLFVIDEAHNFASIDPSPSSKGIEKLAREGRKFNLGLCMASQRCTYMNTSVMAQLKTYFISNLRMKTDRDRIKSIFDINSEILDSSANLSGQDWYIASEVATGLKNTPIKIRVHDVNKRIANSLN